MVDISDIARFENLEDRVTAQLIMTLEQCPKEIVLKEFLRLFDFKDDLEDTQFSLQVGELHSRPDAMIEGKSFLIYIETKLTDSINSVQIENHYRGGKGKKPKFMVVCLTDGFDEPVGIQEAIMRLKVDNELPPIHWTNWREVYKLVKSLDSSIKDTKAAFLLTSLASALEWNGLSGFTSFNREEFLRIKEAIPVFYDVIRKFNHLMDEATSRLEKDSIKLVRFFRDGKANKLDLATFATYHFNKEDWEPRNAKSEKGSEVLVAFHLAISGLMLGLRVQSDIIYGSTAQWKAFIEEIEKPDYHFNVSYNTRASTQVVDIDPETFLQKLEETREEEAIEYADFYYAVDLEDPAVNEIDPDYVVSKVEELLDFLEKFTLYTPVSA